MNKFKDILNENSIRKYKSKKIDDIIMSKWGGIARTFKNDKVANMELARLTDVLVTSDNEYFYISMDTMNNKEVEEIIKKYSLKEITNEAK